MGSTDNPDAEEKIATATVYPPFKDYSKCRASAINVGVIWGLCVGAVLHDAKQRFMGYLGPSKSKMAAVVPVLSGVVIACTVVYLQTRKCKTYIFNREDDFEDDHPDLDMTPRKFFQNIHYPYRTFKD